MKLLDYHKRKKVIYWIISLGIIFLLIANALAWIYLQRIKSFFESDLKFRMENIIQISAKLIDATYLTIIVPGDENDPQVIFYQQLLYDIKEKNNLQDIYIISPARDLLIDVKPDFSIGVLNRSVDPEIINTALSGRAGSSEIYSLGEHKFMTAAVPLVDESNTITGILIAEARAEFFDVIEKFNQGLILFSLINVFVIISASFFLYRSLKNLIGLQNQIKNQEHLVKLGEMAAAVAHEIRNPLGIIRGTNEMIQKKYGKPDDEFFSYIPLELNRLNKLINDFLYFSKTENLNYEKIDLKELLQKLKIGFNDKPGIEISSTIEGEARTIKSDSNALEQILLNILQNSVQSLQDNGSIDIKINKPNKKYTTIKINDNGKGIEKDVLENVFEPFYSTKDQGSGLGLAITKRLVEQLDGNIEITSQINKGTTVTLNFPTLK